MTKVIKLNGKDVAAMVNKIVAESKTKNTETIQENETKTPTKKTGKKIRLTESEMIEFLDKLASKVENSRRRRSE